MFCFTTNSLPDPSNDTFPPSAEEPSHLEQYPQDLGETHLTGMQQIVITTRIDDITQAIHATDLTLGLRRIPAGFHVVIQTGGAESQTSNKPVHIDQAIVEWNERILLEILRAFEISVGELLDRSENSHPIIFQPRQGEVLSPCTSMFVTVEQRSSDENDAAVPCPLPIPTSGDMDATQTSEDLDQSIKHFEHVLGLCPMGHPCRAAAEFHLANAKFVNCQAKGIYLDLNIPINLFQDALYLCPTGHPDRPVTQLHLVIALLSLFATRGSQTASDAAKGLLSEVLNVCHTNSHIYRAALVAFKTSTLYPARNTDANDLGQKQLAASMLPLSPNQLSLKVAQCLQRDDPHDLDEVISLHYDALGYYNTMHTRQGQVLCNLGVLLQTRFQRRGNGQDINEAVTLLKETPALHPAALSSLANGLFVRFEHRGNVQDLDDAIALHTETLALVAHQSNVQDLDDAIALHTEALALFPVGDLNWFGSLHNLANQLSTHFEHRSNIQDLDQAITLSKEALALLPTNHSNRSKSLNNLANQLSACFKHRFNDQDLDDAIAFHTEALALFLDLDQAISLSREALTLLPTNHSNRSKSLNNLANQLSTRFGHRGNDQDLDDAMALHREALTLQPYGHPDRTKSLNNLANQHSLRFEYRGNAEDLDQAIALHSEALALCPVGHPDRTKSLNNLANQHSVRFKYRGNDQDLDDAMALHREALALHPDRHPDRIRTLNNFANQYSIHFEYRGNDQDLDQAIALHREALTLHLVGDPNRSKSLYNLANNLSTRSQQRGNDQDLDEAITLHREALGLRPSGHSDRSKSLNCLANRLSNRFDDRGNDQDLDEAITLHREALALSLVGHSDRSGSLSNLAYGLSTRFKHRSNDQDLDEAIMLHREALVLHGVGHPLQPESLHNLAVSLSTCFQHRRNEEALNESRDNLRCALTLLTKHDPRQLEVHESLATVYLLFHQSGLEDPIKDTGNLNAVMDHLKAAANVVSRGLLPRLRASLRWVHHASQHSHGTKLEAYAISMQLLDAYMSVTASVSSRHNAMKEFPSMLAMDAVSCALCSGDPSDTWQSCSGPDAEFRDLSSLLDKPPASHTDGTSRVAVEAEAARYRHLVEDWNRVVEEIRRIEGFSHFLLSPLISDLQEAARDGPIIVLVACKSSCNAIIVPHKRPPISIQLRTNFDKLRRLVLTLQEAIEKEAGPNENQSALIKALRELWDDVVHPVVENLDRFARRGSRIWWCLTSLFSFLPLHTASEYRANGESLSQQYISSYTPSLTALVRARRSHDRSPSVSFAAIGQSRPVGASFTLDSVEPELELVRSLLPPPPTVSFTNITSVDATKSGALRSLRENTWLHFACHGTHKLDEPFESAFLTRDDLLSFLDITQMDLSRHQFAFLSARETTVGASSTPDEVIHLAAGLEFAGVKSVVGTLWKVNDNTVQRLVEAFYKNLCGDSTMNSKRAARALHKAIQSLGCDKDMPLDQRIVFVHIGI
ncbi:CHAT domain-containing protein [Suillus subalutaceus]|uniref:CHAT domain-containing protein n=1 Tax=Suillus subalutaceus TaxID=48586 RepID=UPI001B874227|nr:CHAT domain-containing protein [Suillus subalutaceus]KAG1846184.1 CHAT domain-containing protein [Suillus subalutaceus]